MAPITYPQWEGSIHHREASAEPATPSALARLRAWSGRYWWAILLSLGVGLGQLFRQSTLTDPLGAPLPEGWQLTTPPLYTLLAPLFSLWDGVSMLSLSRLTGFLIGLALAFIIWRTVVRLGRPVRWSRALRLEAGTLLGSVGAFALFVVAGMAWSTRPGRTLAGLSPDEFTVEIHSHTNVSHDVRQWPVAGFDAEASRRWHQRAGVDLLFITDHQTTAGWQRHSAELLPGDTRICPGIEISAHGAHVVVLGDPLPTDPASYRGAPENRARLFAEVAATRGAVAIASLPEYRGRALTFADEGAGGYEIVSASPKANEAPRVERDSVVHLARERGLAVLAAGDQHGYGATPMAWNVVHAPEWRRQADPCALAVARIKSGGLDAVRIAERTRLRPDHWLPGPLTPLGVLAFAWSTQGLAAALSWLAWTWVVALGGTALRDALRRRRTRAILSAVGTLPSPSPRHR